MARNSDPYRRNVRFVRQSGLNLLARAFADVENIEAKLDLAMRSNKWEGEDEEEEIKVRPTLLHLCARCATFDIFL